MYVQGKILGRFILMAALMAGFAVHNAAQTATRTAWQSTHSATRSEDYAGPAACGGCHEAQAEKQMDSEMALSLMRPAESRVLADHAELGFVRGGFTYTLRREGGQSIFTVEDEHGKISEPVYLVVGTGRVFQAYLIQHAGSYYRVPVDYFAARGKLGLDTEADAALPVSLETALGKRLSMKDVQGCLRCHSPATVVGDRLDAEHITPGITCEVCHGPGAKHVAALLAGKPEEAAIFNPAHLTAGEKYDFCSQCHTSAANMKAGNPHGVHSVVSPAYRLEMSRCWSRTDERSHCIACHDPHEPMARETSAYDSKCLACHRQSAAVQSALPGKACHKGQRDCAGCHMPRVAVPNSPILFTDHRIRIAAEGAPYPD